MPIGTTLLSAAPVAKQALKARKVRKQNKVLDEKTSYDKYNLAEVKELRRREEMGALGLTDEERRMIRNQSDAELSRIGEEGENRRRQLMGSMDVGGGQALLQAGLTDTALAGARQQAAAELDELDYQKEKAQRQEIEDRMASEGQRQLEVQKREAELVGEKADRASASIDAAQQHIEQYGQEDTGKLRAVMEEMGIDDPREARRLIKHTSENPGLLKILAGSRKGS